MQNQVRKCRQSSVISVKHDYSSKIDKLQPPQSLYFFAEIFPLIMSIKECSEFFLIFFRSWVINENIKNLVSVST